MKTILSCTISSCCYLMGYFRVGEFSIMLDVVLGQKIIHSVIGVLNKYKLSLEQSGCLVAKQT